MHYAGPVRRHHGSLVIRRARMRWGGGAVSSRRGDHIMAEWLPPYEDTVGEDSNARRTYALDH